MKRTPGRTNTPTTVTNTCTITAILHGPGGHGHSHGLVDRSIVRSRDGVKTVSISLVVLGLATLAQLAIFVVSGSVALLADLVHNFGDALTAIPLGIAFYLRSSRREDRRPVCGRSDLCLGMRRVDRLDRAVAASTYLSRLGVLAAAGVVGFVGNEIAGQVRLRGGKEAQQPSAHRRRESRPSGTKYSLSLVGKRLFVRLGFDRADPLIGIAITVVILKSRGTAGAWSGRPSRGGDEPHSH